MSLVYFEATFEADALAVAQLLGGGEDRIRPLTDPPPSGVTDLREANVLVVLGGPTGQGDEMVQAG